MILREHAIFQLNVATPACSQTKYVCLLIVLYHNIDFCQGFESFHKKLKEHKSIELAEKERMKKHQKEIKRKSKINK